MQPGIYDDLSMDDYHGGPGISSSQLKAAGHSMADFAFPVRKESSAMNLGTAAHLAILEPELFDRYYIDNPRPAADWRQEKAALILHTGGSIDAVADVLKVKPDTAKKYCEAPETLALLEHFAAVPPGSVPALSPDDVALAQAIRDAVMGHPIAGQLFEDGKAEQSFYWQDEATGLLCKCRPDWLRFDGHEISLKTSRSASLEQFQKDAYNMGYHLSTAYYRDGMDILGIPHKPTLIVVAETTDPRPERVSVFALDDEFFLLGRLAYQQGLARIADLMASDEQARWAGYPLEIQTLTAPAWARR
jgi:hypothetical protein